MRSAVKRKCGPPQSHGQPPMCTGLDGSSGDVHVFAAPAPTRAAEGKRCHTMPACVPAAQGGGGGGAWGKGTPSVSRRRSNSATSRDTDGRSGRVFAHAFADELDVLQLEAGKPRVRRAEGPDMLNERGQGAVAVAEQVPLFKDRIVQDAERKHVRGCSGAVSKRFWRRRACCQRTAQETGQGTRRSGLWGTPRQPASRPVVAQHKVVSAQRRCCCCSPSSFWVAAKQYVIHFDIEVHKAKAQHLLTAPCDSKHNRVCRKGVTAIKGVHETSFHVREREARHSHEAVGVNALRAAIERFKGTPPGTIGVLARA